MLQIAQIVFANWKGLSFEQDFEATMLQSLSTQTLLFEHLHADKFFLRQNLMQECKKTMTQAPNMQLHALTVLLWLHMILMSSLMQQGFADMDQSSDPRSSFFFRRSTC